MKRVDPRVVRTQQMLRNALTALILEKGYDAVSIQDIADKAGLRRATFYLHYKDKEELLLRTLHETFEELKQHMDKQPHNLLSEQHDSKMQLTIFKHAQEHADLYRTILSGQGSSVILRYIREYLASDIREELNRVVQDTLSVPVDILANYVASVTLNMVIWWLENGMPYTPEKMADTTSRLVLNGLHGVSRTIGTTIG